MREIQMVDLKAQYEKIGYEIDNAIKSVLETTAFIKGPEVKLFEEELREYMGVRHVVSCANGTDALHLAIMVLGLKLGDEIITTNAIVPVHLFGQCSDMESIMTIARKNDLYIIEDAAQATGADYFFRNGT